MQIQPRANLEYGHNKNAQCYSFSGIHSEPLLNKQPVKHISLLIPGLDKVLQKNVVSHVVKSCGQTLKHNHSALYYSSEKCSEF